MSDKGFPVGQADAAEDASLFASLMTDDDAQQADQGAQSGQEQDQEDGQADEGTEAEQREQQARARDDQGRFAKPDGKPQQDQQPRGDDRHAAGIRRELTEERQRRQAVEAERESERQERARLQGRLEALERQQAQAARPQPQQPQTQADPEPDMWTNPAEWQAWNRRQVIGEARADRERLDTQRIALSFEDAAVQHGDAFRAAYQAFDRLNPQDPVVASTLQRIKLAPDPAAYLMNWHKREQARLEIGADPLAFREKTRAEILKDPAELMKDPAFAQAVAEYYRQQAVQGGQNGGPRTSVNLPPSLNSARGGNTMRGGQEGYDNTDRGLFKSVMS